MNTKYSYEHMNAAKALALVQKAMLERGISDSDIISALGAAASELAYAALYIDGEPVENVMDFVSNDVKIYEIAC